MTLLNIKQPNKKILNEKKPNYSIMPTCTKFAAALMLGGAATMAAAEVSGELGAGYLSSQGNSDTTTINFDANIDYRPSAASRWKHSVFAGAFYAETDEDRSAERYIAGLKSRFDLTKRDYIFGLIDGEKNSFSGIETRYSGVVGYGRSIIEQPAHILNGEVGIGVRRNEFATGNKETDAVARGVLDYAWKISKTSEFTQVFLLEYGQENTYFQSDTGLTLLIAGDFSTKLGYTIKNNSDVPTGTEKTDRYTSISVVYGF